MLRKIRITAAIVCFAIITLLFLDFTGSIHIWFGWLAKIQFLPAILALNVGVVVALVIATLLFGRIYCSVICPLGVMQDIVSWFSSKYKKNRFSFSPAKPWLRYGVLALFVVGLLAGITSATALIAPYSAYGRIANNLLAPLYQWANNGLAYLAERADSYTFYRVDVWIKSLSTLIVASITLVVIAILAWRGGRTYCNTICPVGTVLGALSRFSLLKPVIDTTKCNGCGLCARNCKAECIDSKNHSIDYSRCVTCYDCIENCRQGAIKYRLRKQTSSAPKPADDSRRKFISLTALLAVSATIKAQKTKVDGGLAAIEDKIATKRATAITPPGSLSIRHFSQHCTACQLCVSACPNQVLRPSTRLECFMQPESSYERGYCRPECTLCSQVCPTGAISRITPEQKSSIQVGHAVWVKDRCLPANGGDSCGNCARHCPAGAIRM